ncbi:MULTISPECIES: AI-2E family transporter [Limosilactobacillus]|uniref:AI-2E family transporter n=1 Tax=Limosilactobacillus TaxID=2742598 RepID=UPI00233E764B|nr:MULTISPECIES: AI-2E family transporter [Limosilactobacillus]MDC2842556.1 AI-2E family transporter [Limosilactobacillus mucosae]MDE8678302.1 AI-2E family transporter [Limosilactobacillus mucosae]MDM8220739.1 AI-2E family transporter [Limosilactobacillus mucosae]MDM8315321.1 AI-2E family transporter [Limosilactobacillus mucosae]
MVNAWHRFIDNVPLRRFVVLALLIWVLYLVRGMLSAILLTFIFTYIVVHWVRFVQRWLPKLPSLLVVLVTYAVLIAAVYFAVTKYLPLLITQIIKMVNSVLKFYQSQDGSWLIKQLNHYISAKTVTAQVKHGINLAFSTLTSLTKMAVTFFMSFILSFFYTIELKQMYSFSRLFLTSDLFSWLFEDIYFFGKKFVNTFGVVLEAQFFIALCNTALTTICLMFMHMPQILALALMVFVFSLVPVAGVIISLIPLSMVGYSVGGIRDVIYIIIMIIAIHALESYVLNPKFMSSRTELPIFYTFVVLMVSEKLFGTWGLIVGVPIFTFLLDIMGVKSIGDQKQSE